MGGCLRRCISTTLTVAVETMVASVDLELNFGSEFQVNWKNLMRDRPTAHHGEH
jgi:hypothetical protein